MNNLNDSFSLVSSLSHFYEIGSSILLQNKQTAFSASEAFFYQQTNTTSRTAGDIRKFVHRVAMYSFTLLQVTFAVVNVALTIHSTKKIVEHLGCANRVYVIAIATTLVMLSTTAWFISKITKQEHVFHAKSQIFAGSLQLIGVVQSLALAALTENRMLLLIRASLNGYSLYRNAQFKWMTIRGSSPVRPQLMEPRINRIDVACSTLLQSTSKEDICGVCLDEESSPEEVFCTNGHAFHKECLKGFLASRDSYLFHFNNLTRTSTKDYRDGTYTGTTYSYSATIEEKKLPGCPQCSERPPYNHFGITVCDIDKGTYEASVHTRKTNPKSNQRTFEKIYAVYNMFQATLGVLQQIPEFSGSVTLLRRYLVVPDLVMGCVASRYQKNTKFGLVALASVPLYLGIEYLLGPRLDLTSVSSGGVLARWERPFFERIHRLLDTYRLLTSLVMTKTTKASKAIHISSLLFQGAALFGAMNVSWLRVDQMGMDGAARNVSLHTYAILSSTLAKTQEGVQKSIEYIADFQRALVGKGATSVIGHYTNGALTHRTLEISYRIPEIKDVCEYLVKPFIWTWDGLKGYGSADWYGRLFLRANV